MPVSKNIDKHTPVGFTGCVPDASDSRDYLYEGRVGSSLQSVPISVDLRPYCREIEDQMNTNSCVGNSLVSMVELLLFKHNVDVNLSRLFSYYTARSISGNSQMVDTGVSLRDANKAFNKYGLPSEQSYSFNLDKINTAPPIEIYVEASKLKSTKYERITSLDGIRHSLAKGYPVQLAIKGYGKLMNLSTDLDNHVNEYLPANNTDRKVEFHHAMLAVGYDDAKKYLIVENSWSRGRGSNGFVALSYDVIKYDLTDAWVVTEVEYNGQYYPERPPEVVTPEPIVPKPVVIPHVPPLAPPKPQSFIQNWIQKIKVFFKRLL